MEKFDEQLENRVWQRIHGDVPGTSLQTLMAAERSSAAVFLRLARLSQGEQKAALRQLFETEQRHARILNGMHVALSGKALSVRTAPPAADPPMTALRKCYAAALRTAAEYERRGTDPDHGCVFREMARQEREQCRRILEILGDLS